MTDHISIWRWQLEGDIDAQFARLIAADANGFNRIAVEMMGAQDLPDIAQEHAEMEVKIRAMGLPEDVLQTTLEGFRAMRDEAEQEQAALEEARDFEVEEDRRIGAALASSHMFYDDPYASMEYAQIDAQVERAVQSYKASISKAVGNEGLNLTSYLGVQAERLFEEDAFATLAEVGLDGAIWIWISGDTAYALCHWQEDKELPIDLELTRIETTRLEALRETF